MSKVSGKLIFGMAVTLAASTALAACSQNSEKKDAASASEQGKRGSISTTIYDRGTTPSTEGNIEENRWTKWINQNGPADVKFVAIPRNESPAKLNVLFASASAPDIIFEYDTLTRNSLYNQKQLMPLDDLIQQHSQEYKKLIEQFPQLKKAGTKADGKIYEVGRLNEIYPNRAIFIRQDWLKKLNLKVPETTEELYQVAKAFAERDPDGNGKKDTFGIALSQQSEATINQVFQKVEWVIKDGQVDYEWEAAIAATEFKKQLFNEGIVDKDYMTDKNGAKAKQDFINGKLGIYPVLVNWKSFAVNEVASLKKNVPDAEIIPIAYPKSPLGQFNPSYSNPIQMTAVVNAKAKDPKAVMQYIDFMSKPSTNKTLAYGIEGEHHKLGTNGCPEVINSDKHKTEVSYFGDARMLESSTKILSGTCGIEESFNPQLPDEKAGLELYKMGHKAYMDFNRPMANITHFEHMPQLPKELSVSATELFKAINDLWGKAVLSGASGYSVKQAAEDARKLWDKSKGNEIEKWMEDWYAAEKDKAFLAKDIYDIAKKQLQSK